MNVLWFVIIAIGMLTFLTRLSFVFLSDFWQPPTALTRALRYVPVAVLTGIFIPEILSYQSAPSVGWVNPRLLAGLVSILVAWRTRNAFFTIGVGMGVFWLLTFFSNLFH